MFGTMGFSELIIILVIILIIFGAGRLPQIGEGIGKALKGFKKEVQEPLPQAEPASQTVEATPEANLATATAAHPRADATPAIPPPQPTAPYTPGPELTPGTTAAVMAAAAPQAYQAPPKPAVLTISPPIQQSAASPSPSHQPPTMEERLTQPTVAMRASYPPVPPTAQAKPATKRPSAIVNKEAVARVQAQQVAMRANKQAHGSSQPAGLSPQDMQDFGQGLGEAFRLVRETTAEIRGAIEPQVRVFQTEVDAAQKEIQDSVEVAKQMPAVHEDTPPK
ncbi:MAG: twin-arginine translocase TatA/TatE family subunit [Nitrospiraceae bacterium]